MKTMYKILDAPVNGKWYEAYEVADDFPDVYGWTHIPPAEDMRFPRWDAMLQNWVEDQESLIADLRTENDALKGRLDMTEGALLELANMVLTK